MLMGILRKNVNGDYSFKKWNSPLNMPINKLSVSYYVNIVPRNERMRIPLNKKPANHASLNYLVYKKTKYDRVDNSTDKIHTEVLLSYSTKRGRFKSFYY